MAVLFVCGIFMAVCGSFWLIVEGTVRGLDWLIKTFADDA